VPAAVAARYLHAGTALDAAWALFEMRMLADPGRRANDAWTAITSRYLGIAPRPEWSWWAIRGQLVQEPGYMSNYAVGYVMTAAIRARIREARGSWLERDDPGWYSWVREHLLRFGLERTSGDVVRELLGGPPTPGALVEEIGRAAS
jgi:Zn-dependent M32 family carboxypeptidase